MIQFIKLWQVLIVCFAIISTNVLADMNPEIAALQDQWADINYQMQGDAQEDAFAELADLADSVTSRYPDDPEAWIWSGIIKSTYAGAKGGLGALSLAKASKRDLEKALELNPEAMNGSAYTSLGTLYYSVPGWPIGFGDSDQAEELLSRALEIAPDDIDANYFFAEFLYSKKAYESARTHYLIAQKAAPRPGREVADQGRQAEIVTALARLEGNK